MIYFFFSLFHITFSENNYKMNNIKLIDDDAFCNEYFSFKMYDIFQFVGLLVHNLILNPKNALIFISLK
jgi:hypothetical protein